MMTMMQILERLRERSDEDVRLVLRNQMATITALQIPPDIAAQMLYANGFSLAFKRALFSLLSPVQLALMLCIKPIQRHLFSQLNVQQVVAIVDSPLIPPLFKQMLIAAYPIADRQIILLLLLQRQYVENARAISIQASKNVPSNHQQGDCLMSVGGLQRMPLPPLEISAPLGQSTELLTASRTLVGEIEREVDRFQNNPEDESIRTMIINKVTKLMRMSKTLNDPDKIRAVDTLLLSIKTQSPAKIGSCLESVNANFNQHTTKRSYRLSAV